MERVYFNNFLNMCIKTLNDSYFQTEGVINCPHQDSNLRSLPFLNVQSFLALNALPTELGMWVPDKVCFLNIVIFINFVFISLNKTEPISCLT